MSYKKEKLSSRKSRQRRVRKKVRGTADRPRLCVFRSAQHIYVQAVDDEGGQTLASASTIDPGFKPPEDKGKISKAKSVGAMIAERLIARECKSVVFDRNGFLYHGRIKALADAAREAGLDF